MSGKTIPVDRRAATPDAICISTRAFAARVGISPRTAEALRLQGGGPPFIKLGRRVVYLIADVDRWVEERRRLSTSDAGRGGGL